MGEITIRQRQATTLIDDNIGSGAKQVALDQGSLGVQLGSTATDFVLVVWHSKGP